MYVRATHAAHVAAVRHHPSHPQPRMTLRTILETQMRRPHRQPSRFRMLPALIPFNGKRGGRIQSRPHWQRAYSGALANFPLEWDGGKDNSEPAPSPSRDIRKGFLDTMTILCSVAVS